MKISITSDIHIDFWVKYTNPEQEQEKLIHVFIEKLLPQEMCDTLILAGDIGHHNKQNQILFKVLRKYYKNVLWVHGNHDLYLVSQNIKKQYNWDSFSRLNEMIDISNNMEGIHYLNGNVVEIEGKKIGGTGIWYNYDYAIKEWNKTEIECEYMWNNYMADSSYIGVNNVDSNTVSEIDNIKYFNEEYNLLEKIHKDCDVIVTHVSPDWSKLLDKWKIPQSTFFLFDGSKLLNNLNENNMWIFGHTHDKYFYTHSSGCTMICNPVGYAVPDWKNRDLSQLKFLTMEIGKLKDYNEIFKNDG